VIDVLRNLKGVLKNFVSIMKKGLMAVPDGGCECGDDKECIDTALLPDTYI
jgi:hypothetical protein